MLPFCRLGQLFMIVLNEYETIREIVDRKCGISRYGDGELRLCLGRKQMSQPWSLDLQKALCNILKSDLPNHIVGIPRIFNRDDWPTRKKQEFWKKYAFDIYMRLYNRKKQYASSFITRPDAVAQIDCDHYWGHVKQIWKDRRVLVLQGEGRGFLKDPSLLDTAFGYRVIYGPRYDAFAKRKELINQIMNESEDDWVILISLGPAATVLAYDVCKLGRQAIDAGHLGMFYAHIHPKDKQWDGKPYDADKRIISKAEPTAS